MSLLKNMDRKDRALRKDYGKSRSADFVEKIVIQNVDWTADTFEFSVAPYPDATSGIINAAISTPEIIDGTDTRFFITIADSVTFPDAAELGADVVMFYELQRTTGTDTSTLLYGEFRVHGKAIQ